MLIQANVSVQRRESSNVCWNALSTPGMGVNLWGESPLYVNPASVLCTFAQVLAEGEGGTARDRLARDASARAAPALARRVRCARKQECKAMSRRTETAYKAQSPGELARHSEAPDSGDRVNAAVAPRKFTFLSGEICSTGIRFMPLLFGCLTEARFKGVG